MNEFPPIPPINNDELLNAVSSLARSADCYRQAFLKIMNGESAQGILEEHLEVLLMADKVIQKFYDDLKLKDEDNLWPSMN